MESGFSADNTERLCEVIIETLKELSSKRQAVTPALLRSALSSRPELASLMGHRQIIVHTPIQNRQNGGTRGETSESGKKSEISGQPQEESTPLHLKKFQDFCLRILTEFQVNLGEAHLKRLSDLRQFIDSSSHLEEAFALNEDILALLHEYTQYVNGELKQYTRLMTEIGNNLLEMEGHLLSTFSHTRDSYTSEKSFNIALGKQMEDIEGSLQISKTLTELKGFVVTKLATIKAGLEKKRRQDEQRLQKATKEMSELKVRLEGMKSEVCKFKEQAKTLEEEIFLDPLTGIHNRRAYEQRLQEELKRYHRYKQPFSVLLIDVDHFKTVNDRYGHWAGDRCLEELSKIITGVLRETDFLARYGGEEFIALLPGTMDAGLHTAADRVRQMVENSRFRYQGEVIPLTISIGATHVRPTDETVETLFKRADAALYQAKESGRNRVVRV